MKTINVDSHNVPATARSKNYQTALVTTASSGCGATTPSTTTPTGGASDTAKVAQNLAEDSTDWAKILRKDIDERTENSLSIGKNLAVDGQAILNDVVANTGTFSGMLKAAVVTITGALSASTVSATTMNANTFIGDLIGNANTATRLQTSRTIWGQSYDGSGNVDGRFVLGGTNCFTIEDMSTYRKIQAWGNVPLSINPSGNNVGIGNAAPAYKLDVSGDINSSTVVRATNGLSITGVFAIDYSASYVRLQSVAKDISLNPSGYFVGIGTTTPQYKLDVNGNARIVSDLFADATVGTKNYSGKTVGWRVDNQGNADFRTVYSDELNVLAFTAQVSQALAGSDFLTKSVSKLSVNFNIPNAVGQTARIIVDDLEGFPGIQCFTNGDYIRLRPINRNGGLIVGNVYGTVILDTSYGVNGFSNGTQAYTFTVKSMTNSAGLTVYKGAEVLDYGTSGSGLIARTTLDAMGSPYEQIATWKSDPSNGNNYTIHARLGNLNGIANCSGYGLYSNKAFLTDSVTVGDLTKSNYFLDFSNGKLKVQGDIYLASGHAAVSTLDMSNGISLAVDNIHVGNRNLLTNSKTFEGYRNYSNWSRADLDYQGLYVFYRNAEWGGLGQNYNVVAGKTYTFSANVSGDSQCVVYIFATKPDNSQIAGITSCTYFGNITTWERIGITFTPTESATLYIRVENSVNNSRLNVCGYKLVEGNKDDGWSPAPEDVDAAINLKVSKDGVIGAINLTSEAATISASKINLVGAVTFNSFTSDVQNTINGKADSASHGNFTYIDGNSVYTGTLTANQVNAVAINANSITTGTLSADRIDVVNVVAQGLSARTINANNATITNLKIVTADVSGNITATSGSVGPFSISTIEGLTSTSGENSLLLKARLIRFLGGSTSAVYIGSDILPGSWGSSIISPVRIEESRVSSTSGNAGIYLSVTGASVSDSTDYIANSALFIDRGVITGFRTRQRRLNYSQTLSLLDTTIIDKSSGSDSTYTLPVPQEDGQRIEFITTDRYIKVKPNTGATLQYGTDTTIYTSSRYVTVINYNYAVCIYNAVHSQWIMRDMRASG